MKIDLKLDVPKKIVNEYGGIKVYRELLYDILERYGNSEYFDDEIIAESGVKMKVKKRITIVADILVDDDIDVDRLCICQEISDLGDANSPDLYVGQSDSFEVLDYVEQYESEVN